MVIPEMSVSVCYCHNKNVLPIPCETIPLLGLRYCKQCFQTMSRLETCCSNTFVDEVIHQNRQTIRLLDLHDSSVLGITPHALAEDYSVARELTT